MVDQRGKRHRRRSRRAAARRLRAILAVFAIGVLLALGYLFRPLDSRPTGESQAGLDLPAGSNPAVAIDISSSAAPRRPTYDYSVIPGGAWDEEQLAGAVQRDPVVALHYRDVDPATMRTEVLRSDLLAHVSYRVGDRVYWTKRKVRIRSGETILSNGQTAIRARCGNCISMAPLMPTSEDEPDESQLDALTDIGPVLVAWNWTPYGAPLAAGGLGTDADGSGGLADASQLLPLFPFGVSVFPRGSIADVPNDTLAVGLPPGGLPDSPPGGGTTPPFGVNPPFGGGSPDGEIPVGEPPRPDNPGPDNPGEPPGNGSPPPTFPPTLPPDTTPVPEPATFVLLGSGIAGLFARHWRSKKN